MTTQQIADRLAELCGKGDFEKAQNHPASGGEFPERGLASRKAHQPKIRCGRAGPKQIVRFAGCHRFQCRIGLPACPCACIPYGCPAACALRSTSPRPRE